MICLAIRVEITGMEQKLKSHHRIHLVAGGTKGIGRALVDSLCEKNHEVIVVSRNSPEDSLPSKVTWLQGDVGKPEKFIDSLPARIDCFTFCPGKIVLGNVKRLSREKMLMAFSSSVLDAFDLTQAILPQLSESDQSSIVFISSVAASLGLPNHCAISTAKSALEGFALSLAADLSPKTRINVVAPTLTGTESALNLVGGEKALPIITSKHPLRRIARPEEVAAAIVFLHSFDASSITGQVLKIDAGMKGLKFNDKS